jgi:S1-C subfamily serine protease
MKIGDVIIEANDRSISTPPQLDSMMYTTDLRQPMNVVVLRDNKPVQLHVTLTEVQQHSDGEIEPSDPQSSIIRQLGIMAATLTPGLTNKIGELRIASGVIVVARTADPTDADLESGDIIHAVNNVQVSDVDALRRRFDGLSHGTPVVLQVERQGGLQFVTFEVD